MKCHEKKLSIAFLMGMAIGIWRSTMYKISQPFLHAFVACSSPLISYWSSGYNIDLHSFEKTNQLYNGGCKGQSSLYCPIPGCIHSGTQSKDIGTLNYTRGDYTNWHNLSPMENSSSKEHGWKSVCSARKSSQRAQSRGMMKSHSSAGHNQLVKTVLHSNLRMEREEIVPLALLSNAV